MFPSNRQVFLIALNIQNWLTILIKDYRIPENVVLLIFTLSSNTFDYYNNCIPEQPYTKERVKALRYNSNMWLLALILFFLKYSLTQTTPSYLRKTTISNKYMHTLTFCYYRIVNADYYFNWTTPMDTYYYSDRLKYNLKLYYTTSLNSISSGANTSGFEILLKTAFFQETYVTLSIAKGPANSVADPAVWFSVRIFIFLLPSDVPFMKALPLSKSLYIPFYGNISTLNNHRFTMQVPVIPSFAQYCFYDSAQSIKDKIHLLPSLTQVGVVNPEYANLTSQSNWVYDWDENTTILTFDILISTYESQIMINYLMVEVFALCPNSFKFAEYNLSMGISEKNWFTLYPTNSLSNRYRNVYLQYPFSNDTEVIMGMSITGLSIYSRHFQSITTTASTSLFLVSFNISQGYDSNGGNLGYMGNLSYNIVNPYNCYGYYWIFGLLGGCPNNLVQYNQTHCVCPKGSNFSYASGRCLNCILLFGDTCSICDAFRCLACSNGLYLDKDGNKTLCLNCTQLHGQQCIECSESQCLKCDKNFTLNDSNKCECHLFDNIVDVISGSCIQCGFKFPFCINCTSNGCFRCMDRFNLTNNSCVCFPPKIVSRGSCYSCFQVFGIGCIQCNSSCLQCDTNFKLINNTCQCLSQGFALSNSSCLKCDSLFGVGCLLCNSSTCLSCNYNYQLNSPNCTCPSPTYAITLGACQACSDLFQYCTECNNLTCLLCMKNFRYSNNSCTCQGDRYLTLGGSCRFCENVHNNCVACNRSKCWQCVSNFTLVDGQCQCMSPLISFQSKCMRCQDLKDSLSKCDITAHLEYYQSGNTLYFWFRYNINKQEVRFSSPLQFSVVIQSNTDSVSFNYRPQTSIFVIDLYALNSVSSLRVSLLNQQSIIADGRKLYYNTTSVNVSAVPATANFSYFITSLSTTRNYAILITLLLCFGVFHKLSKSLTIVLVMCLSQSSLPNSLGLVNDILHNKSPFEWVNIALGWNLPRLQCEQLRFVAYDFNKSIFDLALELYIAGIASAILVTYVRGYLQTKQKAKHHFAWRSILKHSKEYLLQNILNLHGLLCFPAMLQLKLIFSQSTTGITKNIANLLFSTYLLAMPCLLIILCLLKYRYCSVSVLFNSLKRTTLTIAVWLLTVFHPYLISAASLFVAAPLSLYVMIAYNGLLLVLWVLCLHLARGRVNYVLVLLKQACLLYLSISLLFNSQDGLLVRGAFFSSLAIGCIQFFQISLKTVMLILVNKQIIKTTACSQAWIDIEEPALLQTQSRGDIPKSE